MGRKLVTVLDHFAEDLAILLGALLVAGGLGWGLAWPAGLVAFGAVAIWWAWWRTRLVKGAAEWASKAPEK